MTPLRITSADGVTSEARLFEGKGEHGLLVLPAMGVNARAYDRLGEALSGKGVTVLVAEHRGGDTSSVRAKKGVDYGYAELLDDAALHVEELRRRTSKPVSVLGHSLGGQLGTVGVSRWWQPGGKLIVIGSGTVY